MKRLLVLTVIVAMAVPSAFAAGAAGKRGAHKNAKGGTTAGSAHGVKTSNVAAGSTSAVVTDSAGNAAAGNAAGVKTQNGAAARAGVTTKSANGTVQHQSGAAATGRRGTMKSQGSATKNADGTGSAHRNTQATSTSGASYDGQTDATKTDTGASVDYSSTCKNAKGEVVPCTKN